MNSPSGKLREKAKRTSKDTRGLRITARRGAFEPENE